MLGWRGPLRRFLTFLLHHRQKQQVKGIFVSLLQCLHLAVPHELLALVDVVCDFGKVLETRYVLEEPVLLILSIVVLFDRDAFPRLLNYPEN